jgi:hypothetical protein
MPNYTLRFGRRLMNLWKSALAFQGHLPPCSMKQCFLATRQSTRVTP